MKKTLTAAVVVLLIVTVAWRVGVIHQYVFPANA